MSRVFGQHWAMCEAAAVRDSYDSMILHIQSIRFQKKNASGARFRALWGRSIFVLG